MNFKLHQQICSEKRVFCTPNDFYVYQIISEVACYALGNNYAFLPSTNIYGVPTLCQAYFFYAQGLDIK